MRIPRLYTRPGHPASPVWGDIPPDVVARAVTQWTAQARAQGFFDAPEDAEAFYDEVVYLLMHRIVAVEAHLLDPAAAPLHQSALPLGAADPLRDLARLESTGDPAACVLSVAHPDSLGFINHRRVVEIDAAARILGRRALRAGMHHVMDACDRAGAEGFDPARNPTLARAVQDALESGLPAGAVRTAIDYARQGYEDVPLPPDREEDTASQVTPFLSVPGAFVESALTDHGFMQSRDGVEVGHARAAALWEALADSLWSAGAPRLFFTEAAGAAAVVPDPFPAAGGGLVAGAGARAPTAAISLTACDAEGLPHAALLMTVALDARAEGPGRPLVLGIADLAAFLMRRGLAYDSDAGRAAAASAMAAVTGAALEASAAMAAVTGPFDFWPDVEKKTLRRLRGAAQAPLDRAAEAGRRHGFRHAHVTGIALTPAMQHALGAATRGIGPVPDIVIDAPPGAAYARTVHPAVLAGLQALGRTPAQIDDILFYVLGHGTLLDAPCIDHAALVARGFPPARLPVLESALKAARDICRALPGLEEEDFARMGFSPADIAAANAYCCGAGRFAGAPHLTPAQAAVFDTAPGIEAELRMQAALEGVMSGSVAHPLVLPPGATVDDVRRTMLRGWDLGVKQVWIARARAALSDPGL